MGDGRNQFITTFMMFTVLLFSTTFMMNFFKNAYNIESSEEVQETAETIAIEETVDESVDDTIEESIENETIGDEEAIHEHSFGEWFISKEPTSDEEGVMGRRCECGEEEFKIIPRMVSDVSEKSLEEGDVKDSNSTIHIIFIIMGFAMLGTCGVIIYKKKEKERLAHLNKLMDEREGQKILEEVRRMDNKTPFEKFCDKTNSDVSFLASINRKINDFEVNKSVSNSLETIRNILKNIDDEKFNKGNIKNLNDIYISSYVNLLVQYKNLENFDNKKDVAKTLNELKDAILKFEVIFNGLLKESLESDLLKANIDSKVIVEFAKSNGLMQEDGLNF